MSEIILAAGMGLVGASIGFILGVLTKKFLNPTIKQYKQAIEDGENYYKTQIARYRGRLKEFSQPSELQSIANSGAQAEDMVNMFLNQLGNIQGMPKWMRPLIPGIQQYAKENPEQVKALIEKFTQAKIGQKNEFADAL